MRGGEARRRPRAFSCVEGARWNWVNTGWKRARPTCKASRELDTPGRYTGRSNSIEWRAPFPSQKHFLFVLSLSLSRISTTASFFLSWPIYPPFVRKISTCQPIDPNRASLPRRRRNALALPCRARIAHVTSVTSGAQLTIRIDRVQRFARRQPISVLPTYLFLDAGISSGYARRSILPPLRSSLLTLRRD